MKLVVFVIACDDYLIYQKEEALWSSYMHVDQDVSVYFLKADPLLEAPYEIRNSVIWAKTVETKIPGVLNKTLLAMEAVLKQRDFDYLLRTSLSSFFVFSRLLTFLKTLPEKRCYAGVVNEYYGLEYASGAGLVLSKDLVELLVKHKKALWNGAEIDDVAIGLFFKQQKIDLLPMPRMDITSFRKWLDKKREIQPETFHFRVRQLEDNALRLTEELYVYKQLIKMFYG